MTNFYDDEHGKKKIHFEIFYVGSDGQENCFNITGTVEEIYAIFYSLLDLFFELGMIPEMSEDDELTSFDLSQENIDRHLKDWST